MDKKIVVIGLGYVGLPLACILAKNGFSVLGVDINRKTVKNLNYKKSDLVEKNLDELLNYVIDNKKLRATTDYSESKNYKNFIICVPTPVDEDKPNMKYLFDSCKKLSNYLKREDLIIVESSVSPGTMGKVSEILEEGSKLKIGKDLLLAHCPERIFPVNVLYEIENNDRIIAGFDDNSLERAEEIYKSFCRGKILKTSIKMAELIKMAENTYRDVNIALANEFGLICEKLGVDVKELIYLANTHPRVNFLSPGCGVGGSCIPKDPVLLNKMLEKEYGFETKLIKTARNVNKLMEKYFVDKIIKNIDDRKNILVLGLAYKGDVADTRDSPAIKIINILMEKGFDVSTYDPLIKEFNDIKTIKNLDEIDKKFDAIIIATDHTEFKEISPEKLKKLCKERALIADGRNILNKEDILSLGLKYIGVGR